MRARTPWGEEPLPHRPAKEPAQGKDPLAALQGLVSQRAAHRRGMQAQGLRQLPPQQRPRHRSPPPEKVLLGRHQGGEAPRQGLLPPADALQHPPGLLNLLAEVVRRLAAGVLPGHLQVGRAEVELGQVRLVHKDLQGPVDLRHPGIGAEVLGLPLNCPRPHRVGVQRPDGLGGRFHLLSGHPQPPGQGPVLFPGQQIQPFLTDGQGHPMVPRLPLQLEGQALPGAPSPHPRRVQGLQGGNPLLQQGLRHPGLGQVRQILRIQPAVVVQQVHQVPAHRQQRLVQPLPVQLLRQEKRQGLRFPVSPARFPHRRPAGGHPLPGQPGHPAGKGVPSGLPGPWRLLHHRVLQGQVLEVVRQFQGGHLQNSHGLEQRRGELQHLRQFQLLLVFHARSPSPNDSSLMIA